MKLTTKTELEYTAPEIIKNELDFLDSYILLEKLKKCISSLEDNLKKYVITHGNININATHVWGKHTVIVEKIELTGGGISVLMDEELSLALKTVATKSSIESAIRLKHLPLKSTLESVMEKLRATGSVSTEKQERFGEFKP